MMPCKGFQWLDDTQSTGLKLPLVRVRGAGVAQHNRDHRASAGALTRKGDKNETCEAKKLERKWVNCRKLQRAGSHRAAAT